MQQKPSWGYFPNYKGLQARETKELRDCFFLNMEIHIYFCNVEKSILNQRVK